MRCCRRCIAAPPLPGCSHVRDTWPLRCLRGHNPPWLFGVRMCSISSNVTRSFPSDKGARSGSFMIASSELADQPAIGPRHRKASSNPLGPRRLKMLWRIGSRIPGSCPARVESRSAPRPMLAVGPGQMAYRPSTPNHSPIDRIGRLNNAERIADRMPSAPIRVVLFTGPSAK